MAPLTEFQVRDLKLGELIKLAHEDWEIPRLSNPKLESVSLSMRANTARVRNTMLVPTSIAGYAERIRRWVDQAEFEITGSLSNLTTSTEDTQNRIRDRFIELQQFEISNAEKIQGTPERDKQVLENHRDALNLLEPILKNPFGAHGFLALFSAHVTGTWTAIESMSGDLWEAALNSHPQILASLRGSSGRISSLASGRQKSTEQSKRDQIESKSVSLNLIQMNDFDLREKMGTLLREKFEFSRLTNIREAYSCAFSEKADAIDSALSNKSLDCLSVVRNVLVHKAGFADAEYARRCRILGAPVTEVGKPVLLDGEVIVSLIKPAIDSAKSLMRAVGDWIEQN
jgi:hypothetical protein